MLRFKQFIILEQQLLEDRIQTLKTKVFKDGFDTSHDPNAEHKDTDKIVDHFANNADPTKKKTHTQWILNQYKKGNIRQEDHPRIKETLSNFETHKGKLKNKDINQYKNLSSVEDAVEPHLGTAGSKKAEKKAVKAEGADLIHNDEKRGVTVHHIKTEKAACSYGAGTKWCTAGKQNNMFNNYNERGPMHVIQHQGRKYQFHNASFQFMDEKDREVSLKDVHPDIQKSLAESDHPEIQKANLRWGNPHLSSKHLNNAINSKDRDIRWDVAKHPNATSDHINKLLDDKYANVRSVAARHTNATPEHISKALGDSNENVRESAIGNPNATPEHISKALGDSDSAVRRAAMRRRKKLTPEHISKALGDSDSDIRDMALKHEHFGTRPEHIYKGLKMPLPEQRRTAIQHPNATPDHIDKALDDSNTGIRAAAANHRNVSTKNIDKALNDKHPDVRTATILNSSKTINSQHIHKALKDADKEVAKTTLNFGNNITSKHIDTAMEHYHEDVHGEAISHPAATQKHWDEYKRRYLSDRSPHDVEDMKRNLNNFRSKKDANAKPFS
jgi:hypothetical protein